MIKLPDDQALERVVYHDKRRVGEGTGAFCPPSVPVTHSESTCRVMHVLMCLVTCKNIDKFGTFKFVAKY